LILDDQLAALRNAIPASTARRATTSTSRCSSTASTAEREQGITIDVAYRFFSTAEAQVHRRRHARP
jgi:sulfate adenylyltransferase subunit 1 (EFTu-like GTPase family)